MGRTKSVEESSSPKLKVIGVGYGRTGTDSLKEALNILGYRTFHTKEMFRNERIFQHFDDTVFRLDHAEMRRPDLTLIAQAGYNATMDMPLSLYYKELYEDYYPDAKFILSVRKSPDKWMESWQFLIETVSYVIRFAPFLPKVYPIDRYNRWLMALLHGGDDTFLTMPHPRVTASQDHRAIESYLAHNDAVRRLIPKRQLLEIDLSDNLGWDPLCEFLEMKDDDCPRDIPFPRGNSKAEVRKEVLGVVIGANIILLLILLLIVYFVLRFYNMRHQNNNNSSNKRMKETKED